jgi:hypothetical protein
MDQGVMQRCKCAGQPCELCTHKDEVEHCASELQRKAVCCSARPSAAAPGRLLQRQAVCCSSRPSAAAPGRLLQRQDTRCGPSKSGIPGSPRKWSTLAMLGTAVEEVDIRTGLACRQVLRQASCACTLLVMKSCNCHVLTCHPCKGLPEKESVRPWWPCACSRVEMTHGHPWLTTLTYAEAAANQTF